MTEPAGSRAIRVYVVDDHEIVRRGLREFLEEAGIAVVGSAGSAAEAMTGIAAVRPDVAILDGRLPDGSGIDLCRDVRSRDPGVACLILTAYDDDQALFGAIMAGAAGYVLKTIAGADLVDAVRRVSAGQCLLNVELTTRVLARLREGAGEDPRLGRLSPQERKILVLIGDGLTNRQIGARLFLAEKTVKNYVSALLAKLGMERRTQAAVFVTTLPDRPW